MPHYPLPDFIGSDARLSLFQDRMWVVFKYDGFAVQRIEQNGGVFVMNHAFLPVTAPCFIPERSPAYVEIVDVEGGRYRLEEQERHCERMPFESDTEVYVIDTDLPVDPFFADNMCAFATGLVGLKSKPLWTDRFYKDEQKHVSPFAQYASFVNSNNFIYPCSPWPTTGWKSDGEREYVHIATNRVLFGGTASMKDMLRLFQWPARMSVGMFFRKRPTEELMELMWDRCHTFCKLYKDSHRGLQHTITSARWTDPEIETKPKQRKSQNIPMSRRASRERFDVKIIEITTTGRDL